MTKKALNATEFANMTEAEQLDTLQKHGAYAGKRIVNGQIFMLFQLNGFYVEVQYRQYRKDVSRIVSSSDLDLLSPYLDQIPIRDLDKNKETDEMK